MTCRPTTDKELRAMYERLNKRWFNGALDVKVSFVDLSDDGDNGAFQNGEIEIDTALRKVGDLVEIILLHEMVHAELSPEYQNAHGMRFQARILELIKQGAYDDLL